MIEVFVAEPHHAAIIEPRDYCTADPQWREKLYRAIKSCEAYTLVHNGKIVAIVGFMFLFENTVETWAAITNGVQECGISFARVTKNLLDTFCINSKIHRAQFLVPLTIPAFLHFALFLGFKHEGILAKYGPQGEDYAIMGRIF